MFSNETQEGVFFESSWKTERTVKDGFAQTSEIITYEADAQAVFKKDIEIQTDEEPEKEIAIANDDNSQKLNDFLLRVYPELSRQLEANIRSHAFDGYDVDWEEKSSSVTCEFNLVNEDKEESSLCTWNIDRKTLKTNKPDSTIDLSSCLMSIAFHPKLPAVIAGGTFNGEVQVWDLSKEDDLLIGTSGLGNESHREPVTKVMWISDAASKGKKYQSKPLLSLEPGAGYLFRVRWSPVRPLVFSVVTADGRLLIYDLKVFNAHSSHTYGYFIWFACRG
ncbi:WD repeat-containing protein 34 [Exaiptasia diaphana]|nr:WD repeat-containing protein 34 [Exaiptasia diaphana]